MKTVEDVLVEVKEALYLGLSMREILNNYIYDMDASEEVLSKAIDIMKDNEW